MPANPPSRDDDIIELTEIVEQGSVGISDDDDFLTTAQGNDSFERELEDLFADSPEDDASDDALLLDDVVDTLEETSAPLPLDQDEELRPEAFTDDDFDIALDEVIDDQEMTDDFDFGASSAQPETVGEKDEDDDFPELEPDAGAAMSGATGATSEDDYDIDDLDAALGIDRSEGGGLADDIGATQFQNGEMDFSNLDDLDATFADKDNTAVPPPNRNHELNFDTELTDDLEPETIPTAPEPKPAQPFIEDIEETKPAPARSSRTLDEIIDFDDLDDLMDDLDIQPANAEESQPAPPSAELLKDHAFKDNAFEDDALDDDLLDQELGLVDEMSEDDILSDLDKKFREPEDDLDDLLGDLEASTADDDDDWKPAPQKSVEEALAEMELEESDRGVKTPLPDEDFDLDALGVEMRLNGAKRPEPEADHDDEEIPGLMEPWNEVSDDDLLEEFDGQTVAQPSTDESFPDLDELLASLDEEEEADDDDIDLDSVEPAAASVVDDAFPLFDDRLAALEQRIQEFDSRHGADAALMTEVLNRLDDLEQQEPESGLERQLETVRTALDQALSSDSEFMERLVEAVRARLMDDIETQVSELVEQRLNNFAPRSDLEGLAPLSALEDKARTNDLTALTERVADLEERASTLDLETRVSAIEARPLPDAALPGRLDALEGQTMSRAEWNEQLEGIKSDIMREVEHAAAQAAALIIREELSALLSESDDEEPAG